VAASHHHHHGLVGGSSLRLGLAALALAAFMAGELTVGLLAHSLALVSDASHMLLDVGALVLSLVAVRLAGRPPGRLLTYGWQRFEALAAQGSGALMLLLAGAIVYGSILRLAHPPHVHGWAMVGAGLIGVVVNGVATAALAGGREHSLAVEGSYQHVANDLLAFIATVLAGAVIVATGFARADAIASLLVAMLIIRSGVVLLAASGRILLEAAPPGLEPATIGPALVGVEGVVEVHDLHVWQLTSGFPVLTAHVLIEPGKDHHELRLALEQLLQSRFGIHHSTLQLDHAVGRQLIELKPPERRH